MSDTGVDAGRALAEELDHMGRRTTDPEASDLLIQAAQEVEGLQAENEKLREWADVAFNLINRIDVTTAQDANDRAGLLTAYKRMPPVAVALIPFSTTSDERKDVTT